MQELNRGEFKMSEKTITAAKFLDLNIGNVTFVDVREKDDVLCPPARKRGEYRIFAAFKAH